MLSTLSNFLPSALHNPLSSNKSEEKDGALKGASAESKEGQPESSDAVSGIVGGGESELSARKKAKPAPLNETFIVVRPPPAKTNHPLNLQLQLVPPSTQRIVSGSSTTSGMSRLSIDSIRPIPDSAPPSPSTTISHTAAPNRSVTDISVYSTNSTSSLASTASSSIGARRIVPLYNLHAHNVMQNTVLDAGTDAKVARFMKRGMDIVDLCFLELFEVWGKALSQADMPKSAGKRSSFFASNGDSPPFKDDKSLKRASTSSLRSSSVSSNHDHQTSPKKDLKPIEEVSFLSPGDGEETPKRSGAKKFFGKMFKKKEMDSPLLNLPGGGTTAQHILTPTMSHSSTEPSLAPSINLESPTESTPTARTSKQFTPLLAAPVLDLQAILIKNDASAHRPTSYTWIVRKWVKKNRFEGIKGMITAAGDKVSNFNIAGLGFGSENSFDEVELRFEWTRSEKGRAKRGRKIAAVTTSDERAPPTATQADGGLKAPSATSLVVEDNRSEKHPSPSPRAVSPSKSSHSSPDSSVNHDGVGEDSDPEDSETPWNCVMFLQRKRSHHSASHLLHLPHFHSNSSAPDSPSPNKKREEEKEKGAPSTPKGGSAFSNISLKEDTPNSEFPLTKIKIATLSPAPHHPKIVAQMKVQFPLPDVDILNCSMHRRKDGLPSTHKDHDHMMTAEEMKDIVCATAFWLVVREGFGGVGKERRKGDGWRIRA